MAFFRSLLELLDRNNRAYENGFSSRKLFSFKPTVTNLIENISKKLKSVPNNKGYMLIAIVPKSELDVAIDLVQGKTQISLKNTLLVIMQICTRNKNPILFIVQGPNNQILREANAISELLIAIKKAILNDCRGLECMNLPRRDISIISSIPIEIFSQKLSAQKRNSSDEDADKKLNTVLTVETTTIEKEKQAKNSTLLKATPASLQQSVL